MINYLKNLIERLAGYFTNKTMAQELYGPPDPNYWNKEPQVLYGPAPVPKYGIVPVYERDWLVIGEYVIGGILFVLALFFIWRKFFRKKHDQKSDKSGKTES